MMQPSKYEARAWQDIQAFRGRPLSRGIRAAGEQAGNGAAALGKAASKYVEKHVWVQSAATRGQAIVTKAASLTAAGAKKAAGSVADATDGWGGTALHAMKQTVGRVSRVGLSPQRVIAKHQKRGHAVAELRDLRRLDLEQVDDVRGRGASWYYPLAAALSGMGAGLVVSGGSAVVTVSAGAAVAPSGAAIAGAMFGDSAMVLALASRSVGHVSMLYGYDPEEPVEKLFVMSVVNAGTALSSTAKSAAMSDISRLTQALVRGKSWAVLDKSVLTQVSKRFAGAFSTRFTKQSLGKVVPVAGVAIGGALNWTTLESIVDAADMAYRRRFLLEKYPQLADEDSLTLLAEESGGPAEESDETISVLDDLYDAGGDDIPFVGA